MPYSREPISCRFCGTILFPDKDGNCDCYCEATYATTTKAELIEELSSLNLREKYRAVRALSLLNDVGATWTVINAMLEESDPNDHFEIHSEQSRFRNLVATLISLLPDPPPPAWQRLAPGRSKRRKIEALLNHEDRALRNAAKRLTALFVDSSRAAELEQEAENEAKNEHQDRIDHHRKAKEDERLEIERRVKTVLSNKALPYAANLCDLLDILYEFCVSIAKIRSDALQLKVWQKSIWIIGHEICRRGGVRLMRSVVDDMLSYEELYSRRGDGPEEIGWTWRDIDGFEIEPHLYLRKRYVHTFKEHIEGKPKNIARLAELLSEYTRGLSPSIAGTATSSEIHYRVRRYCLEGVRYSETPNVELEPLRLPGTVLLLKIEPSELKLQVTMHPTLAGPTLETQEHKLSVSNMKELESAKPIIERAVTRLTHPTA